MPSENIAYKTRAKNVKMYNKRICTFVPTTFASNFACALCELCFAEVVVKIKRTKRHEGIQFALQRAE